MTPRASNSTATAPTGTTDGRRLPGTNPSKSSASDRPRTAPTATPSPSTASSGGPLPPRPNEPDPRYRPGSGDFEAGEGVGGAPGGEDVEEFDGAAAVLSAGEA